MDSFESIVALYLEAQGFWVKNNVWVNISKADKGKIGLSTMPRPEIDLVAYKPADNELLLIEAKSYLDSPGVRYADLIGRGKRKKTIRLFQNKKFREVVTKQVIKDFRKTGLIAGRVSPHYALATGQIKKGDEDNIQAHFDRNKWKLFTRKQISQVLKDMAKRGYENHPVVMAAKMILR